MLNHTTALERLQKPRNQTTKKIGYRTWLSLIDTGLEGGPGVALRYYDTTIIEYLPDGRVVLRPAYWVTHRKTQDKMNESMPHGWRMEMRNFAHSKCWSPIVSKRSPTWEMLWSVPLMDGETYDADGCEDLRNTLYAKGRARADLFFQDAAETTTATVNAFLRGELEADHTIEEMHDEEDLGRGTPDGERNEVLRLVGKRAPSAALLSMALSRFDQTELHTPLHRMRCHLYWRPRFAASDPSPRTLKAKAAQMELLLLGGTAGVRLKGNDDRFFEGRSWLKMELEKYLFEAAGFSIHPKD